MKRFLLAVAALAVATPSAGFSQPADLPIAPATTSDYPEGVTVRQSSNGAVYTTRAGQTLYGLDMRTVLRWAPDPALYCRDECASQWRPLLAPANASPNIRFPRGPQRGPSASGAQQVFVDPQKAPDWTVISGPQGPQWVYKGWHLVFTRIGDHRGSTEFDGADGLTWNTLKFVPPVPAIIAPPAVTTRFDGKSWTFADMEGRVLFTGKCQTGCTRWRPLQAAMSAHPLGQWTIVHDGDQAQWALHGKLVYVSHEDDPTAVPAGGKVLKP